MSALIENTARGIHGGLLSLSASRPSATDAQERRGVEMIKQMLTGGAMFGGGVGALVALRNQVKSLREESEAEDPERLDDNTIYIPGGPTTKAATINRWAAPGLAVTGAVLSSAGTYALVQAISDRIVRKRREQLLDDAQKGTSEAVEQEVKAAGVQMTAGDLLAAFPVATTLLAASAAGSLTYSALNKSFPTVKPTTPTGPKRLRVMHDDGTVGMADEDEQKEVPAEKQAAMRELDDAGCEFLVHWVAAQLPQGITADFVKKAARGELHEVEDTVIDIGVDAAVSVSKTAGALPDAPTRALAVMSLVKSATLRPTLEVVAAAEFVEAMPAFYERYVANHDPDTLAKLAHVGALLGVCARSSADVEDTVKKASAEQMRGMTAKEILQKILQAGPATGRSRLPFDSGGGSRDDDALTSDVSGGMSDDADSNRASHATEGGDVVDAVMTGR